MNLNDNPKKLKEEEQRVLDNLIARMDKKISKLDEKMKHYVDEAQNEDISLNPDAYCKRVLAQKGIRDTKENRKRLFQSRDELYNTRLLLHSKTENSENIMEIKIGLHPCLLDGEVVIASWNLPLCRHYILDNAATEYCNISEGKYHTEYRTDYTLLVKNKVDLRFTHVARALSLVPGVFDEELLNTIKESDFFSDEFVDELIQKFDPEKYDPESAAKIIADEFLQELLERRSTSEFKNIVFSIQKKQGEIIQAPYKNNMIVQGCAGSGKSMIMLHRLPIILYDNPNSLKRNNIYIITPSQMYVQMAQNMRYQLEIEDVNMGTIEQYYDYCIEKYPGHSAGEYREIGSFKRMPKEIESYMYSKGCLEDIRKYLEDNTTTDFKFLQDAEEIMDIDTKSVRKNKSYSSRLQNSILLFQRIINENRDALTHYFKGIVEFLDVLRDLNVTLRYRESEITRNINKNILEEKGLIERIEKELKSLNDTENSVAVGNRKSVIGSAKIRLDVLKEDLTTIKADRQYFQNLMRLASELDLIIKPFQKLNREFSENSDTVIYDAIYKKDRLMKEFSAFSLGMIKQEDKYIQYANPLEKEMKKAKNALGKLQLITDLYLDYEYVSEIKNRQKSLVNRQEEIVQDTYIYITQKLLNDDKTNHVFKCTPYLYLQILYQFYGVPNAKLESLLALDEAQGIATEEIRLLKNVNAGKVVFNIFGDMYQHIEGTKGIDSWDEYKDIIKFDKYEMQENYRNASQVTEYCNDQFGMKMVAINTPGRGVHEIRSDKEFYKEIKQQLLDTPRIGLAAILVSDDIEVKYILDVFSDYRYKFNDMTGNEADIHKTRWNIININDAKGLEFNTVIVISGRMTQNEKYIAYTRALDELFVYSNIIEIEDQKQEPILEINNDLKETNKKSVIKKSSHTMKHMDIKKDKDITNSEVRAFFEEKGMKVIDKRTEGGRLWIIGDKDSIKKNVNTAISKFKISGKYGKSKESGMQFGWYTKTNK